MRRADPEFLKEQYETLYSYEGDIIHPRLGKIQPYGSGSTRDEEFMKYLGEHVQPGARVLDASCGRGRLLRMLLEAGYDAEGTEIASPLFKEDGDLHGLPARRVDYADIGKEWPPDTFDVVISYDVLEHLAGKGEVARAMQELGMLSNHYFLISVGLGYATRYCTALKMPIQLLHRVRKPAEWWRQMFMQFAIILEERAKPAGYTAFGDVR